MAVDAHHPAPQLQQQIPGTEAATPTTQVEPKADIANGSADPGAANGPSKRSRGKGGRRGRGVAKVARKAVSADQEGGFSNLPDFLASFAPEAPKLNIIVNAAKHLEAKAAEYETAAKLLRTQAARMTAVRDALAKLGEK